MSRYILHVGTAGIKRVVYQNHILDWSNLKILGAQQQ